MTPLHLDLTKLSAARRADDGGRPCSSEYRGPRRRLLELLRTRGSRPRGAPRVRPHAPPPLRAVRHPASRLRGQCAPDWHGQTISHPSTHARYLGALKLTGKERVLEVGTGRIPNVLLSHLAGQVFSIERVAPLLESARAAIRAAAARNVSLIAGDGTLGWGVARHLTPSSLLRLT